METAHKTPPKVTIKLREKLTEDYPYTFKLGGEAGFGIMSAGLLFSKVAVRSGYYTFSYAEYPSLIRGGHNVVQVSVCDKPVNSQYKRTNFLVALNQETVDLHKHELSSGAYVLYDLDLDFNVSLSNLSNGVFKFGVPLGKIAQKVGGSLIVRNTVALGAAIALLGGNLSHLKDIIAEEFRDKDKKVVEVNHKACQEGYDYIHKHYKDKVLEILCQRTDVEKQIVISGNEAIALGAIASGLKFAAIYPMTPISNILHTLAPLQQRYGFIYKQPEDEISGINMAIGASFAGARSMVATSGGGFCLMTEGYGLAGITETPLVIIEGMRGAPATGLPTWTEQGDLRFVLHAHQGDFPRIILAPGDVKEAFYLTLKAFNLADKYQTPVVILVDKYLCEGYMSVSPFEYSNYKVDRGKFTQEKKENYTRYQIFEDGVSLRTTPGSGNFFISNSDEHNEVGYSNEDAKNRREQMQKRMTKLRTCEENDMDAPVLYGFKDAKTTIVSWGSNKGPILEALKKVDDVNYLHITWLNPFPVKQVKEVLENAGRIINVECNYTAQLGGLIREKTGIEIKENLLKYDGRPVYPEEILERFN